VAIHLLSAGGSIDKTYSPLSSSFEVGGPQAGRILREGGLGEEVVEEAVCRKDSLDLTPADRALIVEAVRRSPHRKILITHGTDTAAETALALRGVQGKVIVVTGALRPAAFRDSDAPFNLGFAVAALETLPPGVYLAFHGRLFDPERVTKNAAKDQFEPV
jgi:L-asparaginase